MKAKVLGFLKGTLKASTALLGAASAVSAATFVPAPYNQYAALAVVVLTWVVTYFVPFLQETVETFPEDAADELVRLAEEDGLYELEDVLPTTMLGAVTTDTVEIPKVSMPPAPAATVGIPLVEAETSVDEILDRLREEGSLPVV